MIYEDKFHRSMWHNAHPNPEKEGPQREHLVALQNHVSDFFRKWKGKNPHEFEEKLIQNFLSDIEKKEGLEHKPQPVYMDGDTSLKNALQGNGTITIVNKTKYMFLPYWFSFKDSASSILEMHSLRKLPKELVNHIKFFQEKVAAEPCDIQDKNTTCPSTLEQALRLEDLSESNLKVT